MKTVGFLFFLLPAVLQCQTTSTPTARFHTNLGDIDVTLLPGSAPKTVANFMNYMNRGAYDNSVIHRLVNGFIFQGGGYQLVNHALVAIPQDPAVQNEYGLPNTRGTIAMAKTDGDPNSATNQWFFNTVDNSTTLNQNNNGGFTVFGKVANAASLAIMDRIAAQQVPGILASPFDQIPLIDYTSGALQDSNFVVVLSVSLVVSAPVISNNGIVTAGGFGGFVSAAPGSFVEIYGTNLAETTRGWAGTDFTNGNAPTTLDQVSVTVNGQPAYVNYVSPGQVNVQIPANVPTGGTVPVVVSHSGQPSAPAQLTMKAVAGGLLATPAFRVATKQYVVALHQNGAFVSNGSLPNLPTAPAIPGETLTFYGVGFGPVSPSTVPLAGQIVTGTSSMTNSLQFNFGTAAGQILYAGLAPNLVGVYQFNVVVPMDAPPGDQRLNVVVGGTSIQQTLFIPVQGQ